MKDQLPPPDPDPGHYVRPTQNWICGKAVEGQTCRIGPDASGRCRATCECVPVLELKEGEKKGRYKCTRPAEYGGPCEHGPLPDGTCGRPITRCQPVRSLRAQRTAFTYAVITATLALLLLALGGEHRWNFVSPGPISAQHSGSSFTSQFQWLHSSAKRGDAGCAACHVSAHSGPSGWVKTALEADPGPLRVHALALTTTADMTTIDLQCERCHLGHTFHEPNVVENHSCSACHQEHQGTGLMKPPTDGNCATCHANAQIMQASFEQGAKLPPDVFNFRPASSRQVFQAARPGRGYTQVIHSFATDHPEFQVLAEKLLDPDTLKFNHQLHLTAPTVPPVNGKRLECLDCHKLDAAGQYRQKISFDQNCRQCHSLQFDAHNPDLAVPHGDPEFARAFLRSLPVQYAEYAVRKQGLAARADLEKFVQEQMRRLREQFVSGEELEQRVFFGDSNQGRAQFPACNYCHEVKPAADAAPLVTKPVIMDRWLARGGFNHAKHLTVACAQCHEVLHSTQTADVLLPSKSTCATCHSPQGGVASGCSTCHSYHAPGNAMPVKVAQEK
ncbi:MAG: hypothetical protein JWQ04_2394 [Pedosphaera sp.]|nr:hypothetical protein [Pedosphaera sp.]